MFRTLKFALHRDPENSRAIGYMATQQNAAYNHGVDVLNREPELPKRSGKHAPDAMNKRITAWRQEDRQRADAPYHIHQEGAEQGWEANQRMQQSRAERLERIAQAEADGEEPKRRDVRPHRRTLAHRSVNAAGSASPSPTGDCSKSPTTVRLSPADSAGSRSTSAPARP